MQYLNSEELSEGDRFFFNMEESKRSLKFFNFSVNPQEIINFLQGHPDYYLENMYIVDKPKINKKGRMNPFLFIMENVEFDITQPEIYTQLFTLLSQRVSDDLFINAKPPAEHADLFISSNECKENLVFSCLSKILFENKKKDNKDIKKRVDLFIDCYNILYNNKERKNSITDLSQFIKNNYLYTLDENNKSCKNLFKIIDCISESPEKKKEIIEMVYSNFFSKWFAHYPVYPNDLNIDREKFKKVIEKFPFFSIDTLPPFEEKSNTFIESLYKEQYMHGVLKFLKNNNKTEDEIFFEMNGLAFQYLNEYWRTDHKKQKERNNILSKLKKYLLEDFNPLLFEKKHGKTLSYFIQINIGNQNDELKDFYLNNLPLIEKEALSKTVISPKIKNTPKRL